MAKHRRTAGKLGSIDPVSLGNLGMMQVVVSGDPIPELGTSGITIMIMAGLLMLWQTIRP